MFFFNVLLIINFFLKLQFCIAFIHSSQLLFYDCGYPRWSVVFTLPNSIFFYYLFYDFYYKAYGKPGDKKNETENKKAISEHNSKSNGIANGVKSENGKVNGILNEGKKID
ncbi:unnamed protein product [Euphydryas editha]|uniref:Very-long-chain 3-oxoacyl-CoA synthase n=1 Tax=Euphydryas editha TaxID=104508 RepID=A0AAU9V7E5_EUPED|nr:unnamed protein product [Euphydryas editha]